MEPIYFTLNNFHVECLDSKIPIELACLHYIVDNDAAYVYVDANEAAETKRACNLTYPTGFLRPTGCQNYKILEGTKSIPCVGCVNDGIDNQITDSMA